MLNRETIDECLEAASVELKKMDYAELDRFAESHGMFDDWQCREVELDSVPVEVFILAGKLGHIRKRISIEITLSTVGGEVPAHTYGRYFERYESGRLYPSLREQARQDAIFKALPYALVGVVVVGVLALVWHLLVRGG